MPKKETSKSTTKVVKKKPSQISETKTKKHSSDNKEILNAPYGASGTSLVEWFILEEYNPKLAWSAGLLVYEKMRKSDAQVFATLLAMELPIRSTKWDIMPASDEEGETGDFEHEVADFVRKALFEKMETPFDDFLREVLTMLPFWFAPFEKVWTADSEFVWLKKLSFRKQNSIHKWQQEDWTAGITQILPQTVVEWVNEWKNLVSIPASKILLFSFRREGENYEGVSVLRSAYKHWYFKETMYKFDAVRHERQSVGIPVIYLPSTASPEDKAEAQRIVANIRASEQTGVVMPWPKEDGWLFEFADMKAGQNTNLFESIKHHNREIAKNILAQFLELGDTESGSKALSEDQSDLFLLSLVAVANQIKDTINRFLIPELVDYNFDGVKEYPKITFEKLGSVDYEKIANILSSLASGELITKDEDLEDYLRTKMNLPARKKDEENPEDAEGGVAVDPEDPEDTPDAWASNEAELDSLQEELDWMQASETLDEENLEFTTDSILEWMEFAVDYLEDHSLEFVAKGDQLSDEHKKAISEALRKKYGSVNQSKAIIDKSIEDKTGEISKAQDKFKADTAWIKKQIEWMRAIHDAIKKGKWTVAQRKQLASEISDLNKKIKAMRGQRDSVVTPLKEFKTAYLKGRTVVNQIIRARKKQVAEKIRSLYDEISSGRKSVKDGTQPLKDDISWNTEQMRSLRKMIAWLPKWDSKRESIKSMIDAMTEENIQNRSAIKKSNADFQGKASWIRSDIKKERDSVKTFHEHGPDCNHEHIPDEAQVFFDASFLGLSRMFNNKFIVELQNECRTPDDYARLKQKGFKFNDYEKDSWRPMTFSERKVNFVSLKRSMETFEKVLQENVDWIVQKQREDILKQIKKAVDDNDIAAVWAVKAKYTADLSQALTDVQKEMFEIGKKSAAVEMAVQVPATKAEVRGAMRVQNDAMIEGMVNDMEVTAKKAAAQVINKKGGSITTTNSAEAVAAAGESIDKVISGQVNALKTLGITGSVNLWRSSIFERYPEKIYWFQFSAILDSRTTETCRSLDGRVVKAWSPEYYMYAPPRHYNCRSIWVEILNEESFKPEFTGVPSSIPANATIETFKDIKAPIVLKGSPVMTVIQKELDETREKLKLLEETWKYKNRADGYRTRIAELEKSLQWSFNEYCREVLVADGIEFKEVSE